MRERPILFSAPMILAILAGTKTQTRRIVTVPWRKSTRALPYEPWYVEEDGRLLVDCSEAADSHGNGDYREFTTCMPMRYGEVGDRLWAKETFAYENLGPDEYPRVVYAADRQAHWHDGKNLSEPFFMEHDYAPKKWRPSIFMPRFVSRITLEVTHVRVERVQDISAQDSLAEGVPRASACGCEVCRRLPAGDMCPADAGEQIRAFAELWEHINGERPGCSWDANPWVWAISFRRLEQP